MVIEKEDKRPLAIQKEDGSFKRTISRGRSKSCIKYKEYCYWQNMNTRCDNPKYREKFPTYKGVTMSDDFKDYDQFVKWCRSQPEFFNSFWVLDKDLLVPRNNVYSKETCCFIPSQVNSFLTVNRLVDNGLPKGVTWCESEGCYKSYCADLSGRNKTLGRFSNPEDAFESYVVYKNSLAKELADKWKDKMRDSVYQVLYNLDIRDYIM